MKKRAGKPSTAGVWYSVWRHFCCSRAKPGLGGGFKLKHTGYPVFRFAKDVIVNNNEVIGEQERMAKVSGMKIPGRSLPLSRSIRPMWW
ncbi:hypothetical protein ACNKHR_02690 [Shigella flexneri]